MFVDISCRRAVLYFCFFYILLNLLLVHLQSGGSQDNGVNRASSQFFNEQNKLTIRSGTKWIVVTSVAENPPEAIWKLLAEPDWLLVIVGDRKGPTKRWSPQPRMHFLSLKDQLSLGYRILKYIPYNSYTRKMIGYLYAIERGAQWIYDTDDDNSPINLGLKQFDYADLISGMLYQRTTTDNGTFDIRNVIFNPYAYFGRPDMWPRGYPLSQLRAPNQQHSHRLCKAIRRPLIQQGLVAKDPDVDAIFRLIKADQNSGLNINFDPYAPPIVLKSGTYSPFNSQNTLFHRDAFFTLWLPVTVAFRVTDIWRGYFAQRLLHFIGGTIGFYPVNAIQKRNAHNYFSDFMEEGALYNDTEKLIKVMDQWNCTAHSTDLCLTELAQLFVRHHFWAKEEIGLAKAWISDLHSIGYRFPIVERAPETDAEYGRPNCRRTFLTFNATADPKQSADEGIFDLYEWCNVALDKRNQFAVRKWDQRYRRITEMGQSLQSKALVITSNYQFISSISVLQRLYAGNFAHIIFCGPFYPQLIFRNDSGFLAVNSLSYIHLYENEIREGFFAYYCTAKAIELRLQNINGFIVIADDAVYNPWNWIVLNRFRMQGVTHRAKNIWWETEYGATAITNTIYALKQIGSSDSESTLGRAWKKYTAEGNKFDHDLVASGDVIKVGDGIAVLAEANIWGVSDWYFVPASNFTVFYELAELMFENHVFHEIAVPKIGAGLKWLNIYRSGDLDIPNGLHIWHNRGYWYDMYNPNLLYFHPIKLSPFGRNLHKRAQFCQTVITAFRDHLWDVENKSTVQDQDEQIQNRSKATEDGNGDCCSELISTSCRNYCITSEMKLNFIYEVLASSLSPGGICSESAVSIIAYFTCRIRHADEVNSWQFSEIYTNYTTSFGDYSSSKSELEMFAKSSGNRTGENASLEVPTTLPRNKSRDLFDPGKMTVRQNSMQNCCRKNLIHRATSGERCMHFCDGEFVLEQVENKRYLSCMEVMMHILNCFRDTTYRAHLIDHFSGTEEVEN